MKPPALKQVPEQIFYKRPFMSYMSTPRQSPSFASSPKVWYNVYGDAYGNE